MTHKRLIVPLAALAFAAPPALASSSPATNDMTSQVSIPFANKGNIFDWETIGDQTILLQDANHDWYQATLQKPVDELPGTVDIGFKTDASGNFDKNSSVVILGKTYALKSLTRSYGPPAIQYGPGA